MEIPGWNAALAAEWEQAYPAEAHSIQVRHAIRLPGASAASPPLLEEELEQFVRLMFKSDRNVSIIVRFFGFDGTGKKTLEEVGKEFNVTSERVRQITSKFTRWTGAWHGRNDVYLPIFRSACNFIIETLPASLSAISETLFSKRLARTSSISLEL